MKNILGGALLMAVAALFMVMWNGPHTAYATGDVLSADSLSSLGAISFTPLIPPDWSSTYAATADSVAITITGGGASKGDTGSGEFRVDFAPFMCDSTGWHDFTLSGYRFIPGAECAPHTAYVNLVIDGKLVFPLSTTSAYAAYSTADSLWFEDDIPHTVSFIGGCGAAANTSFDQPSVTFTFLIPSLDAE